MKLDFRNLTILTALAYFAFALTGMRAPGLLLVTTKEER